MTMPECERCRGTGFEIALVEGADGEEREVARRCACRHPTAGDNADRLRAALRIPPRYEHCTFLNFEVEEGIPQRDALARVMRYCSTYLERGAVHPNDRGLGLLFTGGNGTGKTHLAVAVLRELAERYGARGQFWDYHELMREIRNSYNPATALTEYELLEPIIELEVLLLDDLGAWKMTDWMNDTLFYILNQRYLAQRPTLITTNYPDKELSARELSQAETTLRREYLVDRIGHRLRSRLLEACTVVRLEGRDRRQVALQASNQRLLQ